MVFRTESSICPFRKSRVSIFWPQKDNAAFSKKHLLSLGHFHCCRAGQAWKIRVFLLLFCAFFEGKFGKADVMSVFGIGLVPETARIQNSRHIVLYIVSTIGIMIARPVSGISGDVSVIFLIK